MQRYEKVYKEQYSNRADGRSERYTPEDFEEAASNGEYPDHIREDLAL